MPRDKRPSRGADCEESSLQFSLGSPRLAPRRTRKGTAVAFQARSRAQDETQLTELDCHTAVFACSRHHHTLTHARTLARPLAVSPRKHTPWHGCGGRRRAGCGGLHGRAATCMEERRRSTVPEAGHTGGASGGCGVMANIPAPTPRRSRSRSRSDRPSARQPGDAASSRRLPRAPSCPFRTLLQLESNTSERRPACACFPRMERSLYDDRRRRLAAAHPPRPPAQNRPDRRSIALGPTERTRWREVNSRPWTAITTAITLPLMPPPRRSPKAIPSPHIAGLTYRAALRCVASEG